MAEILPAHVMEPEVSVTMYARSRTAMAAKIQAHQGTVRQ
jgi:hypothetical protein